MKKILVTGGAGYIGSHCCKELKRRGFFPVVIDNLITGQFRNIKWGDFFIGDIDNKEVLDQCFKEHKFDAIIHFAAHAYVGESMSDPLKYYDNNVKKTISLIIRIVQEKIPYFIFSSSCSVYGLPNSLPIEECHPVSPISPYGRSKVIIEQILNDCFHAYGLNSISLRYFNAAGADPDNELGEYHNPETHLIPNVLNAALNPEKSIIVFGTDYPTLDGTCIRDYLHVSDIAEAHVLALQYIDTNKGSHTFNLGSGKGYSVKQIIQRVCEITGRDIPWVPEERRPGDPPELIAAYRSAKSKLCWEPHYSDIDTIIQTAWTWHQKKQ